ncbi:hypothetical protein Tco_0618779 [Tanacetum coccineum]
MSFFSPIAIPNAVAGFSLPSSRGACPSPDIDGIRGSYGSASTLNNSEARVAMALGTTSTHAANCSPARHPLQVLGVVDEGSLFSIRLVW